MNIKLLCVSAAAAALLSAPAFALNPQPEPPGKTQVMNQAPNEANHAAMSSSMRGGTAADADDNYCGNGPHRVPVHSNWGSAAMRTNTAAHCNSVKTAPMQGGAMTH
jgi:hypothetical protein